MQVHEYVPKLTKREKLTAIMVGTGLGALLEAVIVIFQNFFENVRYLALPVFVIGSTLLLAFVYLRKR